MEGIIDKYFDDTEKINIGDPEDAREFVADMIERGERPCVSVSSKYIKFLKEGLKPHSSWTPGFNMIVGTIGRDPYLPKNESRVIVRIKEIDLNNIRPRFTGPDKAFHGVVVFNGPVNSDAIEILN